MRERKTNCGPRLLPRESVLDMRGNPAEPRVLCEMKRQSWEFDESKIARVCRTEYYKKALEL